MSVLVGVGMSSCEQVSNDGGLIGRVMSNRPPNLISMGMGISGQWVCPGDMFREGGYICPEGGYPYHVTYPMMHVNLSLPPCTDKQL